MSIAEFLDGMPSFDVRNFSHFRQSNIKKNYLPDYTLRKDQPSNQSAVTDHSHFPSKNFQVIAKQKPGDKRQFIETIEERNSMPSKHQKID